jgi:putative methylase
MDDKPCAKVFWRAGIDDKPCAPPVPVRRKDLEDRLAQVPRHPAPRPELEQYRTPDAVAAGLLLHADADGAIQGRRVLDLGCGTGLFAIGAALLGARLATGVDVDPASIALAQQAAGHAGVADRTWFIAAELRDWHPEPATFDTVVMNPPFGAQAAGRHADRLFLQRAAEAVKPGGGTVWFLAQERTERFLSAFATELGGALERVAVWDYPLEATMKHHQEQVRLVRVGGYRLGFG